MRFGRTSPTSRRGVRLASLLSLWLAARLLGAQEMLPQPMVIVEDDATDSQETVPLPLSAAEFPRAVSSATMFPYQLQAIEESPRTVDRYLEALPHLLSYPNESWGDFLSWTLHSPRVEVPTSLDEIPYHEIHPIPKRPPLLMEWGEPFLSVGPLKPGIEMPSGAVWRPALWVFGEYRSAWQYTDPGDEPVAEWANRLELFGQLNFTGTERVLLGLRPLDEELVDGRRFSSLDFRDASINGFNSQIQTLFFDGDFGELFPHLDSHDVRRLDYGFSVGRMPLLAQQGLLINEDRIDAITVTRNTLFTKRIINLRLTGIYAWGSVNRNSPDFGVPNTEDENSNLVALLTESDFARTTVNADVVYVESDEERGDLIAFGLSGIQRHQGYYNTYNSSLHLLGSFATNGETPTAQQGELLFAQTSWTPHHYEDLIYLNAFLAIDQFTSPARGTLAGGPLGQTGLLFSAPGIGRVSAPINVSANDSTGASLGYQYFFDETRQQLVYELGGQSDIDGSNRGVIASGMRYQRAIGHHWIAVFDVTTAKRESARVATSMRAEARAKF